MKKAPVIKQLHCVICGYKWFPKHPTKLPIACSNCRRADYLNGTGPHSIQAAKLRMAKAGK